MTRRLAACFVCLVGTVLAQSADWRFIHPDAKAFVGLKLRRVKESPLGKSFREQLQDQKFPDLSAFPGVDLLNQIDEILVSSPGKPEGAADDAQPPVLIRITGSFDANRIESFFAHSGAKMQKYRHYRVFRHKGDGDMAASLVDPHTLLVGDAPSLFAALERVEWTDAPKNDLLPRAIELESSYDIWALFAVTPAAFSSVQLPPLAALEALRGLEFAVSVTDGMSLRLGLNTASPEDAAKLANELKTLLAFAVKQHASQPEMTSLMKNLRFEVDAASVRLQAKIGPEEMKKALAEAKHQIAHKRAEIAAIRETPQVVAPPPGPRVIRIEGLDDGPREIPYNK